MVNRSAKPFFLWATNSKIPRFSKKKNFKKAKYPWKAAFMNAFNMFSYLPLFHFRKLITMAYMRDKTSPWAQFWAVAGSISRHQRPVCLHTGCPKDWASGTKRQRGKRQKNKPQTPHMWEGIAGSGSKCYTSEMCEATKAWPWVIPVLHQLAFKLLPVEFNRHNRK